MYKLRTIEKLLRPTASAAYSTLSKPQAAFIAKHTVGARYAGSVAAEPFLNGSSSVYVEEMYNAWKEDPNSVHKVCFSTLLYSICTKALDDFQQLLF